ncbi:MAG TPA: competence/damage-inducible protein A [Candidatus Acidoferrales bacterium]|nr:competence/damage-inducible protein A [Candidatus Acidoferrales bacterium]
MPSVEIVTIGTELLLGQSVDTNSVHIAQELAAHGIDVFAKHSVGDNAQRLEAMLRDVMERADGAVTTGGLGPTVDDITKEAVALAVGTELELHEPSLRAIEARFVRMGRTMSENNRRQAVLPRGSVVLENPNGTAPGFVAVRPDGKFVACMPGVPAEMKAMLAQRLLPWLVERLRVHGGIFTRTLHTSGVPESELDERIHDLFASLENPKIAMLARRWMGVDVKIMAKAPDAVAAQALIAPVEAALRERIGRAVYGTDDDTLESAIVRIFAAHGQHLATAESVTGGGIADALVRVPGASSCFRGGVVAYDNAVKIDVLGVDATLIAEFGAVSEEVAVAMAVGVKRLLRSEIAIATTGIAGPTGATPAKPVGLVWFALVAEQGEIRTQRVIFPGSRDDVRQRAIMTALSSLWRVADMLESVRH